MSTPDRALSLVRELQRRLANHVDAIAVSAGDPPLTSIEWLRDGGRHGGGTRFVAVETCAFDRVAINVSHVYYDDNPQKSLASATALSTILHPTNPRAPSMHMHISWTQLKAAAGGWRLMADLNPCLANEGDESAFRAVLRASAPELYDHASAQGDKYFHIPALHRHRGVAHFYLEGHASADADEDLELARRFGESVADCYVSLVRRAMAANPTPRPTDLAAQLAYHTVYLLQVLTLDRGTTSGILVHNQNDVGILGSLPSHVDVDLLRSWTGRLPKPQDKLLTQILEVLGPQSPAAVTDDCRGQIAAVIRAHYRAYPEALALQASGFTIPPTVANHDPS